MSEASTSQVEIVVKSGAHVAPVLERLVSAAAARAELPIDRVVNALTIVDVLVAATDEVLVDGQRELVLTIGEGSLGITVAGLLDGQAEAIRDAASLPEVGNVLDRTARSVGIAREGEHTALVLALD
jgi:hypothetical protein